MTTVAQRPKVSLALQGGGAHGAYGWGAIQRLLEEDVELVGISGASAGALNGAALVSGLAVGGPAGARAALERLWSEVARRSPLVAFDVGSLPFPLLEGWVRSTLEAAKVFGTYFTPMVPGVRNMSALRAIAADAIDLDALRRPSAVALHISATRVADGTPKLFSNDEITLDALMASACLPDLFDAVHIDGEPYWDGGYSANPALEPLLTAGATDLLIVQITPFEVRDVARSLPATMARVSDISFNACLLRDLKALTGLQTAMRDAPPSGGPLRVLDDINLHLMAASPELAARGAGSKSDTRWSAIQDLRAMGYAATDDWLRTHGGELGHRSTLRTPASEAA